MMGALFAVTALLAACLCAPALAQTGVQNDVVFTDAFALSGNAELARRMLTPLAAAQHSGTLLSEQPVNPAGEKFLVAVPAHQGPNGYGLLAFVPAGNRAALPDGWAPVLEKAGIIFVSAAQSGNNEDILGRRVPLAVIAAQNILKRYPVDSARVYVGGVSGGARVAMRIALGYPDLFHGALLDAGSDPIGSDKIPLPPQPLFRQFQNSRLVYINGDDDMLNAGLAAASMRSVRSWCAFDLEAQAIHDMGHGAMNPIALSRALDALAHPQPPEPGVLGDCNAGIQTALDSQFQKVQSLIAGGNLEAAKTLLVQIDARFGGLAGPRSLAFAEGLGLVPKSIPSGK